MTPLAGQLTTHFRFLTWRFCRLSRLLHSISHVVNPPHSDSAMSARAATSIPRTLLRSSSLKRASVAGASSSFRVLASASSSSSAANHPHACCAQSAAASSSGSVRYLNTASPPSTVAGERILNDHDHSKGLKRDWHDKGPVAFDEMLSLTKQPSVSVCGPLPFSFFFFFLLIFSYPP